MQLLTTSLTVFLLCLMYSGLAAQANQSPEQLRYIERYKDIAIREMERSGVPASIKLAQGILESDAGRSFLAQRANNHFGIKCGSEWNGEEVYREDDDFNDRGELIKSCFRGYRNPEASFVAHSEFLRDPNKTFRYGFLFRLE
ncbi:MAG: glucosaminidase domain-containing protein, partial [Lewinella sp.]|nr:glucosaminidase domain-containing protein [Lewinella sp.]